MGALVKTERVPPLKGTSVIIKAGLTAKRMDEVWIV